LVSAWTLDIKPRPPPSIAPRGPPKQHHRTPAVVMHYAAGHRHGRCKPGGERETLLWMPNYDFNWQFTYEFVEPFKAPAGTVFEMVSHHDNSADNPFNPKIPPIDVKFGLATSDEMAFTGFSYTVDDESLGVTPWVRSRRRRRAAIGGQ
jgi:hypothetical protein